MKSRNHITTKPIVAILNLLTIAGALAITISLSIDIGAAQYLIAPRMMMIRFVVSLVFVADYIVGVACSERKGHYAVANLWLLLVSLPYLNILLLTGAGMSKTLYLTLRCLPIVRGLYGIYIAIRSVTPNKIHTFFWSYLFITLAITYLSGVIFFSYEAGINPKVDTLGNAVWWASMSFTTVGASIFAVTTIGKVLSALLPGLGMVLFPIFTVYFTALFQHKQIPK